jgi:hypothetical protein
LKGKGTLVALALLLVLVLWSKFFEKGEVRQPGETPPVSDLVGMKPEDVTRVELLNEGKSIVLVKSGTQWRIEKPVQARADDAQVKQVLEGLLNGKVDQMVAENTTDFKQYGLDKPAFQVTLTDAKGHQKVIQTGVKDVRGFSVYAREAGSPQLFLVSSFSIEDLQKKKADDLRDKTVLALDPNAVNSLAIQAGGQTTRVEKQGSKWQITAPQPAPADSEMVTQVLDQMKNLKVDHFESGGADLSRYGLAPPQVTVTVNGTGGEKGLLLGKLAPGGKDVYATRPGEHEVFDLPKSTLSDLSKKPGDLRDKTLLSFKRDDATGITVTTPAQTLVLARSGRDWNITKPTPGKPKEDRLSTLLFTLEVVKGSRLVEEKPKDLAKYGLDKPEVRVQISLPKGPQELLIGKKAGANEYYARSSSQDAVFTVPDFTVTDLKVKPNDLLMGSPQTANPKSAK